MSESENVDDISEYRPNRHEVEEKMADVASEEHALKREFGNDPDAKRMQYDARESGKLFVDLYQDQGAPIREALSNAETACIDAAELLLEEDGVPEEDIPQNVSKLFEMAKERVGYEPIVEIEHNEKEMEPTLTIKDNGIGISVRRYNVLRNKGYSTSHSEGNRGDGFGIGYMSLFQLVGNDGSFRIYTRSRKTDDAYSVVSFLANFDYLDTIPERYGTTFEFPELSYQAKQLDVHGKVEKFTQGMWVPVLFRHFDEDGQETHLSDDYLPHMLEDDYDEDDVTIIFEDEYFKAVCSPSSPKGRSYITYNVNAPINRNGPGWGSNSALNAPWKWDFRSKREDGPIVRGPNEGLIPISDNGYAKADAEQREKLIPRSEMEDDDIVMPVPASSRDSFKDGHADFWNYVSDLLQAQWRVIAKDILENVDDFDEFLSREKKEQNLVFKAYQKFGPGRSSAADAIESRLDKTLDADVDGDTFSRISHMFEKVNVFPNRNVRALKSNCHSEQIIDIIQRDGDVYIGQTLSDKKAALVYELSDNNTVVQCGTDKYDEYQRLFGWKLLKNLPSRNLSEKFDGLSDSFIEEWEGSDSSSRSSKQQSLNPRTRRIEIQGNRSAKMKADDVKNALENGGINIYAGTIKNLVIYDTNNEHANPSYSNSDTSVAEVPRYVYEYLYECDNVFTEEEMREKHNNYKVDGKPVVEYGEDHAFVFISNELREYLDGDYDVLTKYTPHDVESVSVLEKGEEDNFSFADLDARKYTSYGVRVSGYTANLEEKDARIVLSEELPDVDLSEPEAKQVFGRYPDYIDETFLNLVETIKAAGGFQKA